MAKIFERNPDDGKIRSREINHPTTDEIIEFNRKNATTAQSAMSRSEILDEIWAANKHVKDGEWYVKLSDVCAILGEDYVSRKA